MDPQKIRDMLMVDEEQLAVTILEKVRTHLGLDKEGRVYIRSPPRYRHKDQIALYLLGVRLAAEAKLREGDTATLTELCQQLGLDSKTAAARLADLRSEGKVEAAGRGENRILFARALAILNDIEANAKE